MLSRRSGILLHITSLPSRFGMGDMGPGAYRFVDFLVKAGQTLWQLLPLSPTTAQVNYSPYSSISAMAGNTLLISPELLHQDGYLTQDDLREVPELPHDGVDFAKAAPVKNEFLRRAYVHFRTRPKDTLFDQFCEDNRTWLDDYALFRAIRLHFDHTLWTDWPPELRDRKPSSMRAIAEELRQEIEGSKFVQYLFHKQWLRLKHYCIERGIQVIGDLPIYVSHDSADVWANPHIFQLDAQKRPTALSGMPASRFNEQGQLWGTPLYSWTRLKQDDYEWWVQRIRRNIQMFSWIRFDHFLGLVSYWKIPATATSARQGRWVRGPREDFFRVLYRRFSGLPFIAEDLGFVSADSREIMAKYNLPGMRVLVDAFSGPTGLNRFLPHYHPENSVVYTGTHDCNTARGWFEHAPLEEKTRLQDYLGHEVAPANVHMELIRMALASVANSAVIQMQDLLGLGQEARMNWPGIAEGNWGWRVRDQQFTPDLAAMLADLTRLYGRG